MTKKPFARLNLRIDVDALSSLEAMAAKKHVSVSEIARRYIERGILVEGHADNIDFIERQLERVIDRTVVARIERHIGLTVKGIIASAAGYFLTARVLESMVPTEYQQDYREALAEARRRGIDYVKLNAREMEEQLNAGLILPDDESESHTDNM